VKPVDLLSSKAAPSTSKAQKPVTKTMKRKNLHLEHKPSDEMDLLISEVNMMNLGWKADVCKYQKTHPLYGKQCNAISLAQVNDEEDDLVDTTADTSS